ncbi:PREDICTED: uncharacterized protein LOC104753702 [Camelina sativa]|uniref:Uncharacterized protein LOC104753702 n=1 Tax=Camelina sativa TaxID=90675 RepID=A0ABM1R2T5_CAMSA|nr:PREDICTED: uncharacterized protein LOC104753702 [Camelina sativa]
MKVEELICPISKTWDVPKIRSILPYYEDKITILRPSELGASDQYIWLLTKSGEYSAKTGYHAATDRDKPNLPVHNPNFNWNKNIWNLHCPPKVCFLVWKAMRNALPTGQNLRIRGINPSATCPHCNADESVFHLLFHCPYALEVWRSAPFKTPPHAELFTNTQQGIEGINKLTCLPPYGIGLGNLAPWILWMLWYSRNKKNFENRLFSCSEVITLGIVAAREWLAAQHQIPVSKSSDQIRTTPDIRLDTIQCFSDASWREETKEAGFGWIFVDRSQSSKIKAISVATKVASALLLAIYQALDIGFKRVSFASDSLQLIKALNMEASFKEFHGIHHDILNLSLSFDSVSFIFVPRKENMEADALAKSTLISPPTVPFPY